MMEEFTKILTRFQTDLYRKLCLRLTPEHFFSIPVWCFFHMLPIFLQLWSKASHFLQLPGEHVQLGEVASIISQTSAQSSTTQPTAQILIDLSGRPDLVSPARAAVAQFLLDDKSSSSSNKRSKGNSSSTDLIQPAGQTQFTVRLRTVVTGEVRNDLTKKGGFLDF